MPRGRRRSKTRRKRGEKDASERNVNLTRGQTEPFLKMMLRRTVCLYFLLDFSVKLLRKLNYKQSGCVSQDKSCYAVVTDSLKNLVHKQNHSHLSMCSHRIHLGSAC